MIRKLLFDVIKSSRSNLLGLGMGYLVLNPDQSLSNSPDFVTETWSQGKCSLIDRWVQVKRLTACVSHLGLFLSINVFSTTLLLMEMVAESTVKT